MYKILLVLVIILSTIILNSCFTYGRPESIFVNFVGRDLENFVEYEKTGQISIQNMDYSIVYVRRSMVEMGPPERQSRGMYQVSSLVLGKLIDNKEEIIIHEGSVERAVVDKENQLLFFLYRERIDDSYRYYLAIYNLVTMQVVNRIMILDTIKYNRDEWFLSGGYISAIIFDNYQNKLLFQVNFNLDTVYYEGRDYLSLNINSGQIDEILEDQYKESINSLNIPESQFSYVSNGNTMRLFSIVPFSDYLPANYKHKYNGVYINDGANNIRISKKNIHLDSNAIWLEDGKYVVNGSYIYDTSGRMYEVKIADGEILLIF